MHTAALKKRQNAAMHKIEEAAYAFLDDSSLPAEHKETLARGVETASHHNANIRELFKLEALAEMMAAAADPDGYLLLLEAERHAQEEGSQEAEVEDTSAGEAAAGTDAQSADEVIAEDAAAPQDGEPPIEDGVEPTEEAADPVSED